jgi:hypothetical protein
MKEEANGVWTYTTDALSPELYSYKFRVNGMEMLDPSNVYRSRDIASFQNIFIVTKEDGDKRIEAAKLIKDANYVGTFWENGEWRGVLSLDKVMTEAIEKLEKDAEADFEIDWSTLMFVHQLMKSPKGYGVESARRIAAWEQYDEQKQELKPEAENAVTYSGILRKVNEHVRRLSFYDKKMNILRNRLDFAYAGVRMNLKVNDLEEFVAFNDALVGASLPQDDKELQKTLSE